MKPRLKVSPKEGYHHTNLRRALLDAALNHLSNGHVATLTIQQLARDANVSPGAPYHHFADRLELLAALATEGFELWHDSASAAINPSDPPELKLAALARAWLVFSAEHAPYYCVMFLPELSDRRRFDQMHAVAARSLALLMGVLHDAMPQADDDTVAERAVLSWSMLHGFASLRMNGVLGNIPGLPPLASLEDAAASRLAQLTLQ